MAWLAERRLRSPIDDAVSKRRKLSVSSSANGKPPSVRGGGGKEDYIDVAMDEAAGVAEADGPPSGQTPFELKVAGYVHWSLDHNPGFVQAMMSTMQHAPLMGQHGYWRELAKRKPGTTAVLLGRHDNLIQREDYTEDALPLLGGEENVFWRIVPGAHNFPFTNAPEAMEVICEFWGME